MLSSSSPVHRLSLEQPLAMLRNRKGTRRGALLRRVHLFRAFERVTGSVGKLGSTVLGAASWSQCKVPPRQPPLPTLHLLHPLLYTQLSSVNKLRPINTRSFLSLINIIFSSFIYSTRNSSYYTFPLTRVPSISVAPVLRSLHSTASARTLNPQVFIHW